MARELILVAPKITEPRARPGRVEQTEAQAIQNVQGKRDAPIPVPRCTRLYKYPLPSQAPTSQT